MLICSQCEFENPEANKFCQNCGISLTEKTCCGCQGIIPIETKICGLCGTNNHVVLWAIISQKKLVNEISSSDTEKEVTDSDLATQPPKLRIEDITELFTPQGIQTKPSLAILKDQFNTNHRYCFEANFTATEVLNTVYENANTKFWQGKIIDKCPLQKSYLATLQKQRMELLTELKKDFNNSYLSVSQYWNSLGLPTHALPYLFLEKYTPTIPKIHDAWQQQDQGVVLLPDRSQWKLLTDLWLQQKIPILQVIWFLDEIAKLWQPLQKISCAQSLLVEDNLRIDEDQAFCLQQLYLDPQGKTPTLKDLAQTWQRILSVTKLNTIDELNQLLERVISEEIIEVEELRLKLHNISISQEQTESDDIHTNSYLTVNIPPSEPNQNQYDFPESETFQDQGFFTEHDDEMIYSSDFDEQSTAVIPMQLVSVTDASCTDIGLQRDHNEDFYGVNTVIEKSENNGENNLRVRGLYIVCDGMGGHAAGEVASSMAVTHIKKFFETEWQEELPDHDTIKTGILLANETLYQTNINNSRSGSGRMGTTLVMALLQDTQLAIAHVGDSRIYRVTRKQGLEKLTLDHEVGQRDINRGVDPEIAYRRPDAYQLTQALGPRDNNYVRPEIQFFDLTEDCLLLLCSDGLSDNDLLENHWQDYLSPLMATTSNLEQGLFELVNFANEYNGHDNITAILIKIKLKANF
ncbi:protein-serine/threonine phosphatase [Chondrocystis sp. NIES-4102]|nr:protein-serine/threonine phosphatase [Chondrocystis sp. NIES-4102]